MDLPIAHCPNCNSLQKLRTRRRTKNNRRVETYIYCTQCRTEITLQNLSRKDYLARIRGAVKRERVRKRVI